MFKTQRFAAITTSANSKAESKLPAGQQIFAGNKQFNYVIILRGS